MAALAGQRWRVGGIGRGMFAFLAVLLASVLGTIGLSGCGPEQAPPAPRQVGPLRIVVSIAPLAGLVRELAPGAEVTLLVPPGVSEHGYELTPGDVARVRQADMIVGVGMGLEARLEELVRRLDPASRDVVWFADVLSEQERGVPADEDNGHDHGGDSHDGHNHAEHDHDGHSHAADAHDGHDHGSGDPHLWLDPILVERLVATLGPRIEAATQRVGDQGESDTPASLSIARTAAATQSLRDRIMEVDATARLALAPVQGKAIVTHHASHGRFAERYGLRVAATIRVAETMEPTPGQVQEAVRAIQNEGVPAVFVEPQFDSSTASRIAEAAGVRAVVLDPMGDGDWFALMDHTIRTIAGALGGEVPPADGAPGLSGATGAGRTP